MRTETCQLILTLIRPLQRVMGIIAQLECDGKLGGEEVETTYMDTQKVVHG